MTTEQEHIVRCYRCGYCGFPTNSEGFVLTPDHIKSMDVDWGSAEMTHGECCVHLRADSGIDERRMVTEEMAMDAGNPDLEGHYI